jgi:hypothetical protein
VKRVSADEESIVFQLSARERETLMQILQLYPVVPPAHQAVSKELKDSHMTEYQRLLDEALAEQRAANKHHLDAWLAARDRFEKNKAGYRFTLARADCEWVLQVLNDIRVGHWLRLGSPESSVLKPQNLTLKILPTWLAMEMSGYFQMSLLEALES